MADWKPVAHVTGKSRTITIYSDGGGFISSAKFLVKSESGTSHGIYGDKRAALNKAEKEAGSGARVDYV